MLQRRFVPAQNSPDLAPQFQAAWNHQWARYRERSEIDRLSTGGQHAWGDRILDDTYDIVGESSDSDRLVSQSTRWRFSHDRIAGWSHADCIDKSTDD